jgi:two-component system, LuxR family, sensor kinase FixL
MKDKGLPYPFKILESVLHGVAVTDLTGHVLFWNKSAERILGYPNSEVVNKPADMFHTEDETPLSDILRQCRKGEKIDQSWFATHRDGTKVWLDLRLKVVCDPEKGSGMCMISMYDIEEQKFAEYRLQKNIAMTHAIFDTMVDALITVDENDEILSVNKSATEMFGYQEDELTGVNVSILMPFPHNIHHNDYMKTYRETGNAGIIGKRRELQGIRKDGSIFPIEMAVSEVKRDDEHIYAGIIKDISDRRMLEKKILETSDNERRKIGRELHDGLGQMLTGVRMLADSLARRLEANALPGADEVKEIAGMIRDADEYARILARGMVVVDIEHHGLNYSLENLCKRASRLTGVTVAFEETGNTEIAHESMSLHLYRIAQESVSNAIKHGKARNVKIRLSSNPHHTSLIIDDDGIGFDDESGIGLKLNKSNSEVIKWLKDQPGAGLHIMQHRAQMIGGILEIGRTEDDRTRVRCVVPNNLEHF